MKCFVISSHNKLQVVAGLSLFPPFLPKSILVRARQGLSREKHSFWASESRTYRVTFGGATNLPCLQPWKIPGEKLCVWEFLRLKRVADWNLVIRSAQKANQSHQIFPLKKKKTSETLEGRSATFRVQGSVFLVFHDFVVFLSFIDLICCTISCDISIYKNLEQSRREVRVGGSFFQKKKSVLFFCFFICFFSFHPFQNTCVSFHCCFFLSFPFIFCVCFSRFFTFGQVKNNARYGRSRHVPTKVVEFVKLILRP